MELQRPALVFAERFVVQLAQNVARNVADHESHNLVVDPALKIVYGLANRLVERSRRQARA